MEKTITEIAQEVIEANPGWAVRCTELTKIAAKYNVDPFKVLKEMIRLSK